MNEKQRMVSWEIEAAILKRKREVFAKIQQDLREAGRKKRLEDAAKKLEAEARAKARKGDVEAKVLEFPPKLSEQELMRRQMIIDQAWERVLEQRRELDEERARSCHRGPGDSDWNLR